jgi:hypothetical protein
MEDALVKDIMSKSAAYVAATQPQLDKVAADKVAWTAQLTKTAAVLSDRGVLDPGKANAFVDKLASDPVMALQFMEKMARLIGSDNLGRPSNITKIAKDQADPFTREFFPELVTNSSTI